MKYILVTGGTMSGIGKGIVTSAIGAMLKACNVCVTAIKIDPYLNIDAGTFSPYEHGEVFVLNDGSEVDLDLGNYERFLDIKLNKSHNITSGKINQLVITKERRGDYLGKTVQIVPHVTDAIQDWIVKAASEEQDGREPQVCIIELGGTIGDIEGMHFTEALRQLMRRVKRQNFCCCHVNPVTCIGDMKSKLTQASVRTLRSLGLYPDMIVCRSLTPVTLKVREKISYHCDVDLENVFSLPNLDTVYKAPLELSAQGMIRTISACLELNNICICDRLDKWKQISDIAVNAKEEIIVALVGKYTSLRDCYASVLKSIEHACYDIGARPNIRLIESTLLEDNQAEAWDSLRTSHCLIVPGGFGIRGVEGKILAIKWAREYKVPFLGICLGFQLAVIEYARNVIDLSNPHSEEFKSDLSGDDMQPVVIEMLEYQDPEMKLGGTMRLGLRKTIFDDKHTSILRKLYGSDVIEERHRHRYEINPEYINVLSEWGIKFVGRNSDKTRMEILELGESVHPYFIGVQYHPEYLSRPFKPSPPYMGLIAAGKKYRTENTIF